MKPCFHRRLCVVFWIATLCISWGCDNEAVQETDAALVDVGPIPGDQRVNNPVDLGIASDAAELATRLNSVFPNRSSVDGEIAMRLVGSEFIDGVQVMIGADPCRATEVLSSNHIRCIVPAVAQPGRRDVSVIWPDNGAIEVLEDAFSYFIPLEADRLQPATSPATGGILLTLTGRGLTEGTEVFFGTERVRVESADETGESALVRCPEGEPGTVDVTVRNLNGTAVIEDGFSWYEDLMLDSVEPPLGRLDGGEVVRLVGIGLSANSQVYFGGLEADVVEAGLGRRSLRVQTPAGQTPGNVDVQVINPSGEFNLLNGFLYVDETEGGFAVHGMVPRRLPTDGGTPLYVAGQGFNDDTQVWVDDVRLNCVTESPQRLRCTTRPHPQGLASVVVTQGPVESDWPNALTFYAPIEIYDVSPARGSVAGGTRVAIVGRGFDESTRFSFEDRELDVIELIDDQNVVARTPAHRAGWISLKAESEFTQTIMPLAFEYFDPTAQFGGLWGQPIDGSLNVTVIDGMSGAPLPGAQVIVNNVGQNGRWTALTNEQGQATVSEPELRLPAAVTASLAEYTTTTFERLTVENATIVLMPQVPPMGMGDMDPIEPVTLAGQIRGLDLLEKPTNEGFALVCFVETTHSEPGNRLGASPPLPNGLLVEDGPFEIVVGPGEFAVVAMAGYIPAVMKIGYEEGQVPYWTFRDALQPIRMGLRRFVTASPGDRFDDIEIALDLDMDARADVRLGNPSGGVRGAPDLFRVHAIIDLGSDGFFDLRYPLSGDTTQFEVDALPNLNEWPDMGISLRWEGEAEQTNQDELYRYAWAVTSVDTLDEVVTIGPFVGNIEILEPRHQGQMNPFRWVEWRGIAGIDGAMSPTEPADLHLSRVISGQTTLWTHWVPGAANRFQFPQLGAGAQDQDLPEGPLQLNLYSLLIDGPFEFDDFTFNDLNRLKAYSFSYVTFRN
ncbi:MAG: IPT/TIG domain-containing protein [Myxococcota bacterium]|nr:IPT/TIG domain-containing protein [Myxococcota bacterium]